MTPRFETTGGAMIGWFYASWPLAQLSATSDRLTLSVAIAGTYTFSPDQVAAIDTSGWGIRIRHTVLDYPPKLLFWPLRSPEAIVRGIADSGFHASAPAAVAEGRGGLPVRWQATALALTLGLAFVVDWLLAVNRWPESGRAFPHPGPFALLSAVILFTGSLASLRSRWFQSLIVKPERSIGEISPFLRFLSFMFGFASILFLLLILFHYAAPTA